MNKPSIAEVPAYFQGYFNAVPEDSIPDALQNAHAALRKHLSSLSDEKWNYAYAPGKWTIKQMIQHVLDTERIFAYRALCIARGEVQTLPSFDENIYATAATASQRSGADLIDELDTVSKSSLLLFASFTEDAWVRKGKAGSGEFTTRALGFVMAGHVRHHLRILAERYS